MSVSMDVRLENQTVPSESLPNFEDVYGEKKSLDRAAKAAGVASIFSFTHSIGEEDDWAADELGVDEDDEDEMSDAELEKLEAKLDKAKPKVGRWYAAADGLKTVDALLAHRKSRGAAKDSVEQTLNDLRKVLAKAAKSRQRFRLVGE